MDYPASTISLIKGKWYVTVTVPEELRARFKCKQLRRSTGTSDKRQAKKRQHSKTTEIYAKFDAALRAEKRDQQAYALEVVQKLFDFFLRKNGEATRSVKPYLFKNAEQTIGIIDRVANELITGGAMISRLDDSYTDAQALAWEYVDEKVRIATDEFRSPEDRSASMMRGLTSDIAYVDQSERSLLTTILPRYISERPWGRSKTKVEFASKIERFIEVVGDLQVSEIKKQHVYELAETLSSEGKANKTIRSYVTAVRGLLAWCEQKGLIEQHQIYNVNLTNYGSKSQHYLPLSEEDLNKLFAQELPAQDRLIFSMLITTGMRLDEAALVTWESLRTKRGIRYFDLSSAITKNLGSKRTVPLPTCLALPPVGHGRIFNYQLDQDGKASRSASKILSPWIRNVTGDPRKVTHSLRASLKDLLRDQDVSKEINDFITGHVGDDVASSYGTGPSIETKFDALERVSHPWLKRRS